MVPNEGVCPQLHNTTSVVEETAESEQLSADFPGGKLARCVQAVASPDIPTCCCSRCCLVQPDGLRSHHCCDPCPSTSHVFAQRLHNASSGCVGDGRVRGPPFLQPAADPCTVLRAGAATWCTWTRRTASWPAPPSRACPAAACCSCTKSARHASGSAHIHRRSSCCQSHVGPKYGHGTQIDTLSFGLTFRPGMQGHGGRNAGDGDNAFARPCTHARDLVERL